VNKEAKLSAREIPGVGEGKGEEGLRCKNLLTVYQRCLGLLLTGPPSSLRNQYWTDTR